MILFGGIFILCTFSLPYSSIITKLPLTPPLPFLPCDRIIISPVYNNVALCILQGVLKTRPHAPPVGKWADLERLLWDSEPNPGPFLGRFKQWTDSQRPRDTKDWVIKLLNFHGSYNPKKMQIPSQLQSLAKSLKDKIDAVEVGRMATANVEHHCLEAHAIESVFQEGTLGALPWEHGVDASRVAGASHPSEHQNQDVCSLLAQNPLSQNSHAYPIAAIAPPDAAAVPGLPTIRARLITSPIGITNPANLPRNALQLPTLNVLAAMAVPPPPAIAQVLAYLQRLVLGGLPTTGCVRLWSCVSAVPMAGVGQPIVADKVDTIAMHVCIMLTTWMPSMASNVQCWRPQS